MGENLEVAKCSGQTGPPSSTVRPATNCLREEKGAETLRGWGWRGRRKTTVGDVVWRGTGLAPQASLLPHRLTSSFESPHFSPQEGLVTGPGAPRVRGAAEGRGARGRAGNLTRRRRGEATCSPSAESPSPWPRRLRGPQPLGAAGSRRPDG